MSKGPDVIEARFRERCNVGIESKTSVERNAKKLNMISISTISRQMLIF